MADQEAKIATAAAQELAAKTKEMQELRDVSAAVSATVPFTVASKRIGRCCQCFSTLRAIRITLWSH